MSSGPTLEIIPSFTLYGVTNPVTEVTNPVTQEESLTFPRGKKQKAESRKQKSGGRMLRESRNLTEAHEDNEGLFRQPGGRQVIAQRFIAGFTVGICESRQGRQK